jgi:NAD(P)H-flavin reductase
VPVTTLFVRDVRRATPRTRLIRLDTAGSGFLYAAGQAVMAGLHGSPLRKPYSIASAPAETARHGVIELLVQVDDSGGPDPRLELAAPGTALDIDGPFGSFTLPPLGRGARVLLVGGGTGIAPLRSMLVQALDTGMAPIAHVVYSARTADEFAYRDELEALAGDGRITLTLTVTREGGAWEGRRGRVDRALLARSLVSTDTWCLVCGPPTLVADVRAALDSLQVAGDRVGVERFQ